MNKNLNTALKLLGDYRKNVNKRSTFFLTYTSFPKILEWHFSMWRKDLELLGRGHETLELWSQCSQLEIELNQIFKEIISRSLKDGLNVFSFFKAFSEHLDKHENDKVQVKDHDERYYIENLLINFSKVFLEEIGSSPDRFDIWEHYFPEKLKIKSGTLLNSLAQKIMLGEFFQWTINRINGTKEKHYDSALDDVSNKLFPEVDPIKWAVILTFVLSSYNPDNRIKYFIEKPLIFGGFGRIRSFDGTIEDNDNFDTKASNYFNEISKAENENTIGMILTLSKIVPAFYHTFNKKNLLKLITEAEELKFPDDSNKEHKRTMLLDIFNSVLNKTT